jgi:hypothetical protein
MQGDVTLASDLLLAGDRLDWFDWTGLDCS